MSVVDLDFDLDDEELLKEDDEDGNNADLDNLDDLMEGSDLDLENADSKTTITEVKSAGYDDDDDDDDEKYSDPPPKRVLSSADGDISEKLQEKPEPVESDLLDLEERVLLEDDDDFDEKELLGDFDEDGEVLDPVLEEKTAAVDEEGG
eukprot:CAMPEP_0177664530 /NCGR_PEP_ID=MMETSP0447-20121125/20545_1 /TAXON_ID=0 /ORGANISM="Stygamoeba regulata, Strain BSH-02190019" /LENGTH=148 /DNA_ID=CAMNT_0019170513 /DNA_START=91 /DNA_END=533 /DNA_ORIENTATION=-